MVWIVVCLNFVENVFYLGMGEEKVMNHFIVVVVVMVVVVVVVEVVVVVVPWAIFVQLPSKMGYFCPTAFQNGLFLSKVFPRYIFLTEKVVVGGGWYGMDCCLS